MKTQLLKTLRTSTRGWWYHARLRELGDIAEAQNRERESMRGTIKNLREALVDPGAHASIGNCGASLHWSKGGNHHTSLSGGDSFRTTLIPFLALGGTGLDLRNMDLGDILRSPIVAPHDPDPAPWGSMSYAPLSYVAQYTRDHGGKVIN